MERAPLGFCLKLRTPPGTPATHVRPRPGPEHGPGTTPSIVVEPPINVFTHTCDLASQALWTALPPSLVGRCSHDYYESSATPRRQQRTVRLAQTPEGSTGTAGALPTFTHMPVGRVGAQLHPGGIATQHRNTPRSLARPNTNRSDETVLNSKQDRAPRAAHSRQFRGCFPVSGLQPLVSVSLRPFCLATAPSPLAADRCSIVKGRLPPNAAPPASVLPLSFTRPLRRPGAGPFIPPGHMAPRGAVMHRNARSHADRRGHRCLPAPAMQHSGAAEGSASSTVSHSSRRLQAEERSVRSADETAGPGAIRQRVSNADRWILAVVATVGELSICRVSLCVRIILIGELYLAG
jgi:hypothetical protein